MNFLKSIMEYTKHYESPTSFWRWAGITAISAVIRDHVYLPQGETIICPNIYTLLLASSAEHRKGRPIALCEKLVTAVKSTKVISGRSSIQAILDELARGETDKTTGHLMRGGSALFSAPELSAGLVSDPDAIKILTDIYDFRQEYTSRLRGSGIFRIKNVCFTMMAASNEELLRDVYDTKALFGGLLGRTFLIKPDEFRKANSLWEVRDTAETFNGLIKLLKDAATLKGEFEVEPCAQKLYDSWYEPFRESYRGKSDKSGVYGRIHTSILKLAMILCVNETLEKVVLKIHMEEAIEEGIGLIPNYHNFVMGNAKTPVAEVATILIHELFIAKDKTLSRRMILGKHFNQFDSEMLDKAVITLEQGGMIITQMSSEGGVAYRMTEKCGDLLEKGK